MGLEMKEITTIIKEGNRIWLTFSKEEIRLKMPSYFLTQENYDYWIDFIRKIESYIYRDFIQSLRADIPIVDTKNNNFIIIFKTWDKIPIKSFKVKNNKIKITEYMGKHETKFQYIKRRIKYIIFK
jgi:hypothetical protein